MRMKVHRLARCLVALSLMFGASNALANCLVSAQGVSFGSYDSLSGAPSESTGVIDVSCDVQTSYTLSLSPGAGIYTERKMQSGESVLIYNLYTDASYSFIWGDGSGVTTTVSGATATTQLHDVYGRIPAGQDAAVGTYTDTIIVTVQF